MFFFSVLFFFVKLWFGYWYVTFPVTFLLLWKYVLSPLRRILSRNSNFFLKPYSSDSRPPHTANETDLITESYDQSKLRYEVYDIVFVGAGSSGLCGASYAAQEGLKVLLLEQNEQLGGCTHSFIDEETGQFEFDIGMHKVAMDEKFMMLFNKASEGRLKWKRMTELGEPTCLVYVNGDQYADLRGVQAQRESILSQFPDPFDQKCINVYFDDCERLFDEYDFAMMLRYYVPPWLRGFCIWILETFFKVRFFKLNRMNGVEYLAQTFPGDTPTQDTLRGLFCHWYFALSYIHRAAGVWGPLVNGMESRFGGYFPAKGCSDFAKKITSVITKFGGQAFSFARVESLVIDKKKDGKNRVIGVKMVNGDIIRAKLVVTSCGLANTCSMVPKDLWPAEVESFTEPAIFFIQCFLGFSKNWDDLGLPHSDFYMMRTDVPHTNGEDPDEIPSLKYGYDYFYAGNSTPTYPIGENKCTLNLLILSSESQFRRWEGTRIRERGTEYEDLKMAYARPYIDAMFEKYPLLAENLEVESISTNLSYKHWCASAKGESYGCAATPERLFEGYDKAIKGWNIEGLIVSSADASTCDGVMMAALTGLMAAGEILGRDLLMEWKVAMIMGDSERD